MLRKRPAWIRGLRLFALDEDGLPARRWAPADLDQRDRIAARSTFRSLAAPDRYALYWLHDVEASAGQLRCDAVPGVAPDDHTLVAVREFRRVPLHASALGLLVFTALPGYAATAVALLAHFVDRAVSAYQPTYLLLAHSLEEPRIAVLITGADQSAAVQAGRSSAFSVDWLLPELRPLLVEEPELYSYCAELLPVGPSAGRPVGPYAV